MKKQWIFGFVLTAFQLQAGGPVFPPGQTAADMQKMIVFLTSNGSTFGQAGQVGLTYSGEAFSLSGKILPSSFYSSPNYWLKYVGQNSHEFLDVVDNYRDAPDFTLTPNSCFADIPFPVFKCPGDLQVERINSFVGTDIYDAAVWQIALALAGKGGFTGPSGASLFDILENQTTLLTEGQFSSEFKFNLPGALRGTTNGNIFLYGGKPINDPKNAYFFRLVPPSFINADPLYFLTPQPATSNSYITTTSCSACGAQPVPGNQAPQGYFDGTTSWEDFKPITGENAWAFLLGPLQSALIQQASLGTSYVPFANNAVQNAINTLLAFQYMQAPIGGLYYIVSGALGNVGPVDVYTVSVENNFSALGGLFTFQKILNDELANEPNLTAENKATITSTLAALNAMINGGTIAGGTVTNGLLSFLKNQAWNPVKGMFDQGGLANKPGEAAWVPPASTDPQAVDVQTWGIACLGQPTIDSWFGFGTCYNVWQKTKAFGGYYGPDGTLWGVGFSNYDGNGPCSANSKTGVISGEWTAGAINMVRVLITQYGNVAANTVNYTVTQRAQAAAWVVDLEKDQTSMLQNVLKLRTDIYPTTTDFYLTPPDYNQLLYGTPAGPPSDRLAFLYADRRYQVPFGWIANPLPSMASTGWMAYLYFNFNPFNPLGTYDVHATPIGGAVLPVIPPTTSFELTYLLQRIRILQQAQIDRVKNLGAHR